jgi:hypothetical protein
VDAVSHFDKAEEILADRVGIAAGTRALAYAVLAVV